MAPCEQGLGQFESGSRMSNPDKGINVTFWGVRGSTPVPGPDTARYGGNTPCVEVRAGDSIFILDAGTGIQAFGRNYRTKTDKPVKLHLFLTHTHWDHIQGLPFFQLAYDPRNEIHIVGPKREGTALLDCLERQMLPPNFPVPFSLLQGVKSVTELSSGDSLQVGDATIHAAALNHPNESMGFRIEYGDRSLAYCLDHEHGGVDDIHPGVETLAKGADMLVFDAAYTDEEYPSFKGWGHSTWQEGYKTARELDVRILALAGFNPGVVDADLDLIKAEVDALDGETVIATEGSSMAL